MSNLEIPCSALLPVWGAFCSLLYGANQKLLPLAPTVSSFAKKHGFTRRKAKAVVAALIRAGLICRRNGRIALCDPNINILSISLFD